MRQYTRLRRSCCVRRESAGEIASFRMSEATQHPTEPEDDIDLADTEEVSSDAQGVTPVEILAPAVAEVLATAADLASGRGHALISTDDVFAALISSDCAATRMLESLDMRRESCWISLLSYWGATAEPLQYKLLPSRQESSASCTVPGSMPRGGNRVLSIRSICSAPFSGSGVEFPRCCLKHPVWDWNQWAPP